MTSLICIKDLAARLNVSVSCLYQWVSLRKIPYVKLGGKLLFDAEKIDEWIQSKEVSVVNTRNAH